MAYNKADGGVPIKGDASTSGVHNPKTGKVDNPQSLGGSIMNLGKTSGGGMTNISSGAGNEGAGSHKPVLKEDTSRANAGKRLDLGYKERHQFANIGSFGAVAAGNNETFFVSFGPSVSIDGTPFPQDPNDPANEGLDCPTTEEQREKYDMEYLPDCGEGKRCCDAMDEGPCEYRYNIDVLAWDPSIRFNEYIPTNSQDLLLREWILACIDLTIAYTQNQEVTWLEPAAKNFLESPTVYWVGGAHVVNDNICWVELAATRAEESPVTGDFEPVATPNVVEGSYYWSAGSDIDKVLKQFVKKKVDDETYDHGFTGCIPQFHNLVDNDYRLPVKTDEFRWGGVDGLGGIGLGATVKFTLTDWDNIGNIPPPSADHKFWGGDRSGDKFYYLRINSVTDSYNGQDVVVKFQWARQNTNMCENLDANGDWVVSWNAEITIDTAVTPPDYTRTVFEDSWWKVEIENNVSIELPLKDINIRTNPLRGPYELQLLRYGHFDTEIEAENLLRCMSPVVPPEPECACPISIDAEVLKELGCDCYGAGRYLNYPTVLGNIVSDPPNLDASWPEIREATGAIIRKPCNCIDCN